MEKQIGHSMGRNSGKDVIFIDCGGYNGSSVRLAKKLFSPKHIYSFEPNPVFNSSFKKFSHHTLISSAVWTSNCFKTFYVDKRDGDGSSLIEDKQVDYFGDKSMVGQLMVECIDLNEWILDTLSMSDSIYLKLDIEGSEYQVIPHLIEGGSFQYINALFIEWHWDKCGVDESEHDALKEAIGAFDLIVEEWDANEVKSLFARVMRKFSLIWTKF